MINSNSGILTITVDTKKVENMLNGYKRTIPEGLDKATKKIAGMYAQFYLNQLPLAKGIGTPRGIEPWTGEAETILRNQINNPIRLGKGEYAVVVPHYLIMLDQMRNHYVSLKRGRSITKWAQDKLKFRFKKIVVHRHPWIKSANIKAGRNIRRLVESEISKVISRKGR